MQALTLKQRCGASQLQSLQSLQSLQEAGLVLPWKGEAQCSAAERSQAQALVGDIGKAKTHAMELAQVQEKLEACSEAELKQMLKDMKLPTKGKVGAPASPTTPTAPSNSPVAAHSSRHARTSHAGALRA